MSFVFNLTCRLYSLSETIYRLWNICSIVIDMLVYVCQPLVGTGELGIQTIKQTSKVERWGLVSPWQNCCFPRSCILDMPCDWWGMRIYGLSKLRPVLLRWGLGDTSLRSRAVSELIRQEGAAEGLVNSDLYLSSFPSLVYFMPAW